jgi:hypothetical protein
MHPSRRKSKRQRLEFEFDSTPQDTSLLMKTVCDLIANTANTLNPGKGSCNPSDNVLQSPKLELDIKANVHDGVETRLQRTSVLACNLPLQGCIAVLNPGQGSCNASDDVLQSPILDLDTKANVHGGVETCL